MRVCIVFPGTQARKILRELKHQKRCKEAATTIAAYWHGTQVLTQQRSLRRGGRNHNTGRTDTPLLLPF